ncbi:Spindle assembly protein, partial [Globisporangium splendens]
MSSIASFRGESDFHAAAMDTGGVHIPVSGGDDMDPSLGKTWGGWIEFSLDLCVLRMQLTILVIWLMTAGGFRVIYDRETPFELRIQRVGTLEAIKAKILISGDDADIHAVKVELSTESDLFFLYVHTCDADAFHMMQDQQKLMIDFADYANVLIRMLNNCMEEPHNHLAVYLMQADGRARLDFIQNMEYKFVELLSVDFLRVTEDATRQHISFRYNSMKSRLQVLQTRLHGKKKASEDRIVVESFQEQIPHALK